MKLLFISGIVVTSVGIGIFILNKQYNKPDDVDTPPKDFVESDHIHLNDIGKGE